MKTLRHLLEYIPLLFLSSLLGFLSEGALRKLADLLSTLWFAVDGRRKNIARQNILKAMPEDYNESNVEVLIREIFRNCVMTALEMTAYINRNNLDWLQKNVEIIGSENILKAQEKGKGILFFTAHYGNWELTSLKFSQTFNRVTCVYRPLNNPYLNRMLLDTRNGYNQVVVPKQGALRPLLKALKNNEAVGLLVDQHVTPHAEGIWVNFFNRPAATSPIIAQIHAKTGAPVLPVFAERCPDGKHKIHFLPELEMSEGEGAIERNTQRVNDTIEENIRKRPGHWLWLHRRWKTSPGEERG